MELRDGTIDTGPVRLHYVEGHPNGPPFVLLHGGSASWRYGESFIDLLRDDWHVFAPDLRGHGQSDRVRGSYRLRDYTADVAVFLCDLVHEPAVIYGHSLGGQVALIVAAHHPTLVRAVINGDAAITGARDLSGDDARYTMNELWVSLAGKPVSEIEIALKQMPVTVPGRSTTAPAVDVFGQESPWFAFQAWNLHRLDPDVLTAVLAGPHAMLDGYDPVAILRAITCPMLLLRADPTMGSTLEDHVLEEMLSHIGDASVIQLEGVGHELHAVPEHAQQIHECISPFLDRIRDLNQGIV